MSEEIILFKKDLSDWLINRFKECFDVYLDSVDLSPSSNDKFGDFQSNISLENLKN